MTSALSRIAFPVAAVLAASSPAVAQKPPTPDQQRIAILEQQVAAGQATALRLEQRLDSIERQLQQLINQGEVNGHKASELEADIAKLRSDTDSRLTTLESRPVTQQVEAAPVEAASVEEKPKPKVETASATTRPPASKSTASTPKESQSETTEEAAADPAEDAYSQGYHSWRDGNYDQAIAELKSFVSAYPGHRRVSFARNLIGRALLDKGQPRQAAEALLANYRDNPKGERAADSLYYLGQSLMRLNQPGQACKAYAELDDVYGSSVRPDLKSLVAKGEADAHCS